MDSSPINQISRYAPFTTSAIMLGLVLRAWMQTKGPLPIDEGFEAHMFQILAVLQIPMVLLFIVSAKDRSFKKVGPIVGFQVLFCAAVLLVLHLSSLG